MTIFRKYEGLFSCCNRREKRREKRINTCISSKYTAVKGPAVGQNISLSEGASTGPQCSWNIDIGGCQARGAGMGGLSRLGHNGLETLSMSRVGISWIGL